MSKHLGIDLTGKVFGRLTVTGRAGARCKCILWDCKCSCGENHQAVSHVLLNGLSKSCGCLRREVTSARRSKGRKKHYREYTAWLALRNRCNNPNSDDYSQYGGRGIGVSPSWQSSFETFLADMGPRPSGTSIERIDNSKGYDKENCKWGTPTEQARNRRTNRPLTAFGITRIQNDWAREIGVPDSVIYKWLKRGKTLEQFLNRKAVGT